MKVPDDGEETPLAWMAIIENTPVYSADGAGIGGVHEVLGADDIFHGLVVRSGPLGKEMMIPAANVATITNRRIDVNLGDEELRNLPPYVPEESFSLGFVGLFRKHLGWVAGDHDDNPL